jgi:hypothetical protein
MRALQMAVKIDKKSVGLVGVAKLQTLGRCIKELADKDFVPQAYGFNTLRELCESLPNFSVFFQPIQPTLALVRYEHQGDSTKTDIHVISTSKDSVEDGVLADTQTSDIHHQVFMFGRD